jgi:RNA polymerase sigma-70 factor (ECF subfamily)
MSDPQSSIPKRRHDLETSTKPDKILVTEANHSPSAFAELYHRYLKNVYSYFFSRVGDVHHAQDLSTQTFLAAKESIANYQGRGSFAAWLMGIARRKAADHFRRTRETLPLTSVDQLSSPGPPIEEEIDRQLQLEKIAQSLSVLTPDRAEAISLRIFGGLSTAEVAQVMGKSEAAVKMLIHRAVVELQQHLAPHAQKEKSNDP